MLNQRLILIFAFFTLIFCALGVRLVHLQVNEVDEWREKMRAFVHHQNKIETARGTIVDRNGVQLAFDDPCYDLAIDYRAMNLDDRWLGYLARERLKQAGVTDKAERARRFPELKAEIAAKVDAIPDALASLCDTSALTDPSPDAPPREKIYYRFEEIRQRISILRQDYWSRTYDPETDKLKAGESPDDAAYNEPLREERVAHTIIPHIPDAVALYFRQHADDFPGIVVVDSRTRRYPYRNVACQVIGTMRGVDAEAMKKNRFVLPNLLAASEPGNLGGVLPGDRMGETGIEKLCEDQLRGSRGVVLIEEGGMAATAPANGTAGESESLQEKRIAPVAGQSVQLTLDVALQADIEKALYDPSRRLLKGKDDLDHHVALVILSLDGQVLAMVSTPGYDPNTIDDTRVQLIKSKWDRPLANRATEAYRPGSIIKPLVAAAALNDRAIDLQMTVNCVGHLFPGRPLVFKCAEPHGANIGLVKAIAESCNIYFYTVGERMGVDNMARWFRLYGLDSDTGFELPDHGGRLKFRERPDPDTLRNEARFFGIGEGGIDSTPLQMANAYATLLRGGKVIPPRILASTAPQESQAFTLSPGTLEIVKEAMRKTVTMGTAKDTFNRMGLAVAGKTGTADVTNKPVFDENGEQAVDKDHPLTNRDGTPALGPNGERLYRKVYENATHSWFVGYAPADKPKFVVVAFKEFAGFGSKYAAPIVKEAMLELERHNYLPALDVR